MRTIYIIAIGIVLIVALSLLGATKAATPIRRIIQGGVKGSVSSGGPVPHVPLDNGKLPPIRPSQHPSSGPFGNLPGPWTAWDTHSDATSQPTGSETAGTTTASGGGTGDSGGGTGDSGGGTGDSGGGTGDSGGGTGDSGGDTGGGGSQAAPHPLAPSSMYPSPSPPSDQPQPSPLERDLQRQLNEARQRAAWMRETRRWEEERMRQGTDRHHRMLRSPGPQKKRKKKRHKEESPQYPGHYNP